MRQYVGEKRGRIEGLEKATGRAKYAGDFQMENMLELAIVRSTISHGKVRSIDFSALPADVLVFTGKGRTILKIDHCRINGNHISSMEDLNYVLYGCEVGETVETIIYRAGKQYRVSLTLSEAKG